MKIPKGSKRQVPILVSGNVITAPRVVVFFGEIVEDLGVFSYRDACDDGISFGSILGFAKSLLGDDSQDSPNALILANAGQTVWHNSGWFAMTADSVHGQHRSSAVERERPLGARNVIGNGSIGEHVEDIFHQVLMRGNFRVGARIDIIGMSEGGHAAMTYLKNQCKCLTP
jgi:Arb2 domain.